MSINHALRAHCLYLHIGRYHNLHKLTLHCVYIIALLKRSKSSVLYWYIFDKMSASESESDPELDVSRYGIEDDLNRYGSPVYKAREATAALVSEPIQAQAEQNRTQVSVKFNFSVLLHEKCERVLIYYIFSLISFVAAEIHVADAAAGNNEDVHVKTKI